MSERVTFEKIASDGQALGYWNDKAVFVTGPVPGETAEVLIGRQKKNWAQGKLDKLVEASPHRHEPHEEHFMSCSPWQGVDYAYQLELKRSMLASLFGRPELGLAVASLVGSKKQFGYRNKLEFTVETNAYGELGLVFHARGSWQDFVPADHGCVLGSDAMNRAAMSVMGVLRGLDLADFVDTLTVRESQTKTGLIVVILLRAKTTRNWPLLAKIDRLTGIAVVVDDGHGKLETVWSDGLLELSETVGGITITYPWDSFFQVSVPAFATALEAILAHIEPGSAVADLYGGAGTIGLPVAKIADSVLGVEIVKSSVRLANRNAQMNGITNYRAIAVASEHIDTSLLDGIDTVILDPPRAGLHPRVVDYLLEVSPAKIIYLSCNPATQVRDVMLLVEGGYACSQPAGFDFYPGALHLESLVVLTR